MAKQNDSMTYCLLRREPFCEGRRSRSQKLEIAAGRGYARGLIYRGVEERLPRRAHNPKSAGSTPASANVSTKRRLGAVFALRLREEEATCVASVGS